MRAGAYRNADLRKLTYVLHDQDNLQHFLEEDRFSEDTTASGRDLTAEEKQFYRPRLPTNAVDQI